MVNIGDKFKEHLPSWIKGNKNRTMFFDYIYKVIGFKNKLDCAFVECVRIYPNGKTEKVGIDINLFENETFYEKVN